MRQESVQYFTEKEEKFANLLIGIGTKKNIAYVLVFLAGTPEASSRAIERGTDLRQPEVSLAMKYLMEQGWVTCHKDSSEKKGRPKKIFTLVKSLRAILGCIEKEKKNEAKNQIALVRKLRDHV